MVKQLPLHFEYTEERVRGEESIHQGQVSFGTHSQFTYLGSCISLIVMSQYKNVGGLSHIVGRETILGRYNFAGQVLDYFKQLASKHGPFSYYLVGGSDGCEFVLQDTEYQLNTRQLEYTKIDVLGLYYRQVLLIPSKRKVKIYKKTVSRE